MKLHTLFPAIACAVLVNSVHAYPTRYSVQFLGNKDDDRVAHSINNFGDVVGETSAFDEGNSPSSPVALYKGGAIYVGLKDTPVAPHYDSGKANFINNVGDIVGQVGPSFGTGISYYTAFLYHAGEVTYLPSLGGSTTNAAGINDDGLIVGSSSTETGSSHAFIYSAGTMTDITPAGYGLASAVGVNAGGQVVGWCSGNAAAMFVYQNGTTQLITGGLGGDSARPAAINNLGAIVGSSGREAFLYQNGKFTGLGTLGDATGSAANAINNRGVIVGSSNPRKSRDSHAMIYEDGKMIDLNSLVPAKYPETFAEATGINDRGQIVGWARTTGFREAAFLLTPSPVTKITGGTKRVTHKSQLTIRGKGTATVAVILYRMGHGVQHGTQGTPTRWHLTAKLKKGLNVVNVRAVSIDGSSLTSKVFVTRL